MYKRSDQSFSVGDAKSKISVNTILKVCITN